MRAVFAASSVALAILLTACGGGEDLPDNGRSLQADGRATVQPVNCAASGACN